MANFLLALSFIKTFLSSIHDMIDTLDAAVPDGTPGAQKLSVFQGWINQAIAADEKYAPAAQMIGSMVVPLVSAIVAARKAKAA